MNSKVGFTGIATRRTTAHGPLTHIVIDAEGNVARLRKRTVPLNNSDNVNKVNWQVLPVRGPLSFRRTANQCSLL